MNPLLTINWGDVKTLRVDDRLLNILTAKGEQSISFSSKEELTAAIAEWFNGAEFTKAILDQKHLN